MPVAAIPKQCRSVTSCLIVSDGAAAIDFYQRAFGATEVDRLTMPDGKTIMHAEIQIGDSVLYLADSPEMDVARPKEGQWPSITHYLYVDDADATFRSAVDAGCRTIHAVTDMFWGDRMGLVVDPFCNYWAIAQHVEDVPREELPKRMAAIFKEK